MSSLLDQTPLLRLAERLVDAARRAGADAADAVAVRGVSQSIEVLEKHRDAGRRLALLFDEPDRHAAEGLYRNIERDAHALHGTAQDHAFAVKFDVARPHVRPGGVGREADG